MEGKNGKWITHKDLDTLRGCGLSSERWLGQSINIVKLVVGFEVSLPCAVGKPSVKTRHKMPTKYPIINKNCAVLPFSPKNNKNGKENYDAKILSCWLNFILFSYEIFPE